MTIFSLEAYAREAVLFMDLNNSPSEVETAKKAAESIGKQLIVFPELSESQRLKMRKYKKQRENVDKKILKSKCYQSDACGKTASQTCQKLTAEQGKIDALMGEAVPFRWDTGGLKKALKESLLTAKLNGDNISSLVISGHNGGGSFSGTWGLLTPNDISETFDEVPELKSQIRSVALWGCYTSTPGEIDYNWKKALPNLSLISGFAGSGPSEDKQASHDYLDYVIRNEAKILAETDKDRLHAMFKSIRNIEATSASLCAQDNYVENGSAKAMSEIRADVINCEAKFPNKLHEKYHCYDLGKPGCEKLPSNHQKSELREYYEYLRQNDHCIQNHVFAKNHPDLPAADKVIRLIYSDNIISNLKTNHSKELDIFNRNLKAAGAPDSLLLNLDKMGRKDIAQWNHGMQGFEAELKDITLYNAIRTQREEVSSIISGQGAPMEWLDRGSGKKMNLWTFTEIAKCAK